jgi:hypothetical protein
MFRRINIASYQRRIEWSMRKIACGEGRKKQKAARSKALRLRSFGKTRGNHTKVTRKGTSRYYIARLTYTTSS